MDRRLWIGLLLTLGVGFFLTGLASAQGQFGGNRSINDSESANVSVSISSQVWVDITPADFTWTGVDPGGEGNNDSETNNFFALQVENIGSRNISYVWFNATYPGASPFGVGSNANTDSGNYIVLANSSGGPFQFINRVEYNATRTLVYVRDTQGRMPPGAGFVYGRIHNSSNEYFWMINNSVTGYCNGSATLYIGNISHHKTQTGTVDFETGEFETMTLAIHPDDTGWGVADVTNGPFDGYCAAVSSDCTQLFISRWNADRPFDACANSVYAWDRTIDGKLAPGDSFSMRIRAYVPYGIYEGSSNTGYITAIVNEA